jgi:cleavage stimulation factor subunit 2
MAANPKSVFVGNIPFSLSEEQIIQILSNAGQVIRFRLISNPETGKPRGYGFADFNDADAAASAVRNLNGYEIQGRKIRVDWPTEKDQPGQDQPVQAHIDIPQPAPAGAPVLPPLPPGTDLPPNLKATDAISQTLNTLPPPQLLDVLTQMKAMAISEPQRATEILKAAPQLSYAIFQALILMNLVDPKILAQVVEQASAAANPPPPQQYPQPTPTPQQYQYPPQQPPQQQYRPPPQQYPPPQQMQQPPPMQQPQQQQMNPDHNALLQQVLQMDQRTIDSLPAHERAQIMQIRASVGQGQYR